MSDSITPSEKILDSDVWEEWAEATLEQDETATESDALDKAKSLEKEYVHEAERLREEIEELDAAVGSGQIEGIEDELEVLENEYDRLVEEPYIENDSWVIADERNGKPVGILNDTIRWGPEGAKNKIEILGDRRERAQNILESRLPDTRDRTIPAVAPGPYDEGPGGNGGNGNDDGDGNGDDEEPDVSRRGYLWLAVAGTVLGAGAVGYKLGTSGGAAPAPVPGNNTTTTTTTETPVYATTTEVTTTPTTITETTTETPTTTTTSREGKTRGILGYDEFDDEWKELSRDEKRELFNGADNYAQFMDGDVSNQEVNEVHVIYDPEGGPENSQIEYVLEDGKTYIETDQFNISDELAKELLDYEE